MTIHDEVREKIKVSFWRFDGPGAEAIADRAIQRLFERMEGTGASAYRMRSGDFGERVWYIAICGLAEGHAQLSEHVEDGTLCDPPEKGMDDSIRLRWLNNIMGTLLTGESLGFRRYLAGAHLTGDGTIKPRRPQG